MDERHAPAQRREAWPPQPGYFLLRLRPRAWHVPCRIVLTHDEGWQATIDEFVHASHPDPLHAEGVSDVWAFGVITSYADYRWRLDMKEWAREHDPQHPCLHPHRAMDPLHLRPVSTERMKTP